MTQITKEQAVIRWNTRTQPAAPTEDAVEALSETLAHLGQRTYLGTQKHYASVIIDELTTKGWHLCRPTMTETKAPIPDVELTMEAVTYHAGTVIAEEVRDIIAAQAEKIAMLEQDLRLNLIARDVAFKSCAKLEAENKRLRDAMKAIDEIHDGPPASDFTKIGVMRGIACAALAQPVAKS